MKPGVIAVGSALVLSMFGCGSGAAGGDAGTDSGGAGAGLAPR